jgi:hypothetical protein
LTHSLGSCQISDIRALDTEMSRAIKYQDRVEPLLVSCLGAIARAGGLTAAIKRGMYHGLIPPAYRGLGKPTRYLLAKVDESIFGYICTGLIDEPQYLLPSEAKAFADRNYRKGRSR